MKSRSISLFSATLSIWLAIGICSGKAFGQGTTVPNAISSASARNQLAYLTPSLSLQSAREVAMAAFQAKHYETALEQFKMISQSAGATLDDLYWIGESYFHLRRFNEAAKSFEEVVDRNPRAESVKIRVVQSYMSSNQSQVAKQKCSEYLVAVSDPGMKQQLSLLSTYCDCDTNKRVLKNTVQRGLER